MAREYTDPDDSPLLDVGQLFLQTWLWDHESKHGNRIRAGRMRVVQLELAEALDATGLNVGDAARAGQPEQLLGLLPGPTDPRWTRRDRLVFLIEMVCDAPFAPSELDYSQDEHTAALHTLARRLGGSEAHVDWIARWHKSAVGSHRRLDFKRPVLTTTTAAADLAKAQTTFKVVCVDGYGSAADAGPDAALTHMKGQRTDARSRLEELQRRNEDGAAAVRDARDRVKALDEAIEWMNERERRAQEETAPAWETAAA